MKLRYFIIILICIAFYVSCAKENAISISITYKGATTIDINTFAYESIFIDAFPNKKVISSNDAAAGHKSVVIETECLSVDQVALNGRTFNLFSAQAKCKISIIDADGRVLYVKDTDVAKGQGGTAASAEIDVIGALKKQAAEMVAADRTVIADRL